MEPASKDSLPVAAHADRLTDLLRRSGVLGDARVRDVAVESARKMLLSRIVRLRLAYDGTADAAPKALILKTSIPGRPGSSWNPGRQEVRFYTEVAAAMRTRLVPRCFEARWDAEQNARHLLLEDLTETHAVATTWPLPPTNAQMQAIIRARARFHAEWWNDPRLGTTVGASVPGATTGDLQRLADELERFAFRLGDRLTRERRELYGRFIAAAPDLRKNSRRRHNLTVVQGDAHVWNCFLPKDAGSDDVRLFDWDSWGVAPGSDDLANMMTLHFYPDHRRRIERPLLDLYHATLAAHGVAYDRRTLDDDYRLSVLWQIATPVWQAANHLPPVVWWNHLERVLMAVDDLGCRDLLA
jgi:hypothetical protein